MLLSEHEFYIRIHAKHSVSRASHNAHDNPRKWGLSSQSIGEETKARELSNFPQDLAANNMYSLDGNPSLCQRPSFCILYLINVYSFKSICMSAYA